ncbi:MAG: cation transporter [Candidatus Nanopelagicales bacterium]|jgi:cation diffusion facilitator family transporter|nr:cation transporter [Candidatus Nanopelagicales bacterium]
MAPDTQAALLHERKLLRASTATAAAFAAVGIVWGMWAESQIILLDGAYALIGLGLGVLSLRAARLVQRGPTPDYPFGREALAPLVVGIQGMVLLGTFGYASFDAVAVILDGGSETALGSALIYSIVTLAASLAIWWYLRGRAQDSELVLAEAAQWAAGWVLSTGMMIGFGGALILESTSLSWLARYADPVLVLLATAVILPTPLRMIRSMYVELLEGSPPAEVSEPVRKVVEEVAAEHGLPNPTLRMGKLGRKVYVELDFLVESGREVGDADRVRRELMTRLSEPGRLLWINVELHTDPAWDRTV